MTYMYKLASSKHPYALAETEDSECRWCQCIYGSGQ